MHSCFIEVTPFINPVTTLQPENQIPVYVARVMVINMLKANLLLEASVLYKSTELAIILVIIFGINQMSD